MALVDIDIESWPTVQVTGGATGLLLSGVTLAFDSATDRVGYVGRARRTDSIESIRFRLATVTTGCTVEVRVETVTNARPTGTLFGTTTNAVVVIADSDDNSWKTATLTLPASMNMGDEFAIVIIVTLGTPNLQIANFPAGTTQSEIIGQYPTALQDTGAGTWAVVTGGWEWIIEWSTGGVLYTPALNPTSGGGTITSYNSGTSPDERAMRFQISSKRRCVGMLVPLFNVAAGGDLTFSLWDATGDTDAEALGQASIDGDFPSSTTQDGLVALYFDAPVELSIDTTYYAGVRADTANSIGVGEMGNSTVTDAMKAYPGTRGQCWLATRVWTAGTAGAWTETTTTLPLIYLLFDQADDGTGGSGSAASVGNIRGNMQ